MSLITAWINISPTPVSCFWTAQNDELAYYVRDHQVQSEAFMDGTRTCKSHAMRS